jgi:phosphopantothenoylcysteine decarboxylase/phosphopantothenate--cysteine ligase
MHDPLEASEFLRDKNIVLCITGGIAAYKAADLCSMFRKAGATLRVAMTSSAEQFVTPLTFETLTQHPVYGKVLGDATSYEMEHIAWSKWADLLLIAPASANTIAKLACGFADDSVSTLFLSYSGPVIVAPAMNTVMLENQATNENLQKLVSRGVTIIDPTSGRLACGDTGPGKLAPLDEIFRTVASLLSGVDVNHPQEIAEKIEQP